MDLFSPNLHHRCTCPTPFIDQKHDFFGLLRVSIYIVFPFFNLLSSLWPQRVARLVQHLGHESFIWDYILTQLQWHLALGLFSPSYLTVIFDIFSLLYTLYKTAVTLERSRQYTWIEWSLLTSLISWVGLRKGTYSKRSLIENQRLLVFRAVIYVCLL